ncbi:M23 family metallopeptidase [Alkalispirochaeta americana]|nr:M23 family metallopeptidase [Alkalispirochaeta americana]
MKRSASVIPGAPHLFTLVLSLGTLFLGTASLPVTAQTSGATAHLEVYAVQNDDNSFDLFARNDHSIPIYISVDFDQLVNLAPETNLPWRGAIPPGDTRPLFSLTPTAQRGRIGYSLRYQAALGDPATASHHDDHLYLFPFEHGTKRRLSQGFGGSFSHFGENRYAVDFDMPEGTPVYAARGGLVVHVKQDGRAGGPSPAYADHGNVIVIAHDDGSFGNYVHLRFRGSRVQPGDTVSAGDHIGYSGNTGISSGPHLHFDVRLPQRDGTMQSVPFLFRGLQGEAISPEEGHFYYASHPGGEDFPVVFGEDLRNQDFADHLEEVPVTHSVSFRTEEYDLTHAIYLQNGFPEAIRATVGFNLVHMRAEATLPLEIEVPPASEVFLTLLRADPGRDRWQYAPTVRFQRLR